MKQPIHVQHRVEGWYFLFWPVFLFRYLILENCVPVSGYHPVFCSLDNRIPFLEVFVIPYFLWHGCLIGVHIWLYLRRDPAFRAYSKYLIYSITASTAVFILYPTCQNLRPRIFFRENFLSDAVRMLYRMDTNTNVCPSEHVIGAAGFFLAVLYSERRSFRIVFTVGAEAVLSSLGAIFLKQHSVVDVAAALPVCILAWYFSFRMDAGGIPCSEPEKHPDPAQIEK